MATAVSENEVQSDSPKVYLLLKNNIFIHITVSFTKMFNFIICAAAI